MTTTAITAAEPDLKTYWCHECDMSVSLTSSSTPSPLLCPHCHTHFLELMDSPFSQNDAESTTSLFDFQDALLLLTPPSTKQRNEILIPIITVTQTLLTLLDPNGVVLCAVCKEAIYVDEEAKQLPCDHLYHNDCITPWLLLRSSCPLCRFRITEHEVDENDEDDDVMMRQMVLRLSELSEDDFYGLRITLDHIASRHALLHSNASGAAQNLDADSELSAGGVDGES
ncbi:E3 ubiquitin-protein ligase RNF181 [Trifolium pratense]|uniref:E3 ubiquitin-protein ligase RNF181 n=1 Tax=Trifolium pratense TaxID=57577 RepID=UPI001E694869|nr:E3 ubiquitin-protein ligase RNF181 [Trifolium pratense]